MVAREIRLMFEHGLSPMAAIQAGTSAAARLLGLEDETGSVVVGHRADLLLVDGDPLADLDRLSRPVMVVQGGAVRARDPQTGATQDVRTGQHPGIVPATCHRSKIIDLRSDGW
jgi:adenine deaminase